MDIADDIAYSTYDFEDALKAGFISIFDLITHDTEITNKICNKLNKCDDLDKKDYINQDIIEIFFRIINSILHLNDFKKTYTPDGEKYDVGKSIIYLLRQAKKFSDNGYNRVNMTSSLVGRFIRGVEVSEVDNNNPILTKVVLKQYIREEVEVLKNFTYTCLISSSLLKIPSHRGYDIVKTIFDELQKPDGYLLLPDDYKHIFSKIKSNDEKNRIICDFIAGMTDRYVLEFYGRLKSENPQSIFKPI